MIGIAAIHKGMATLWSDNLATTFEANYTADQLARFQSYNEDEAAPNQPFPYCVYEQGTQNQWSRDSGHSGTELHEVYQIPWEFRIYAKKTSTNSAKVEAATLVASVMAIYGGHPTTNPLAKDYALDVGYLLYAQFDGEQSMKAGEDEYEWVIRYTLVVDFPVAI